MRRNVRNTTFNTSDVKYANFTISTPGFTTIHDTNMWPNSISMETLSATPARNFNAIEAKVESGDTLQAIALRFHCSVADIKRMNKIDKDNEIHAHKVLKVPLNIHNVLLDNLPTIHKIGNSSNSSSPKNSSRKQNDSNVASSSGDNTYSKDTGSNNSVSDPHKNDDLKFKERLMIASVSASDHHDSSKFSKGDHTNYTDDDLNYGKK